MSLVLSKSPLIQLLAWKTLPAPIILTKLDNFFCLPLSNCFRDGAFVDGVLSLFTYNI